MDHWLQPLIEETLKAVDTLDAIIPHTLSTSVPAAGHALMYSICETGARWHAAMSQINLPENIGDLVRQHFSNV